MSEKIKIPNFIAKKIDELRKQGLSDYQILTYDDKDFKEYAQLFPQQLMRALLDGYEAKKERLTYETDDYEIWGTTYEQKGEKVPVFKIKLKRVGMFDHYITVHSRRHKDTYRKLYRDLQYLPPKE